MLNQCLKCSNKQAVVLPANKCFNAGWASAFFEKGFQKMSHSIWPWLSASNVWKRHYLTNWPLSFGDFHQCISPIAGFRSVDISLSDCSFPIFQVPLWRYLKIFQDKNASLPSCEDFCKWIDHPLLVFFCGLPQQGTILPILGVKLRFCYFAALPIDSWNNPDKNGFRCDRNDQKLTW